MRPALRRRRYAVGYARRLRLAGANAEMAAVCRQIHEKLFTNPTAALTQGHIETITALGGVGKTTLARQYSEKFWRCYRGTLSLIECTFNDWIKSSWHKWWLLCRQKADLHKLFVARPRARGASG
jgi:hypothetical protein